MFAETYHPSPRKPPRVSESAGPAFVGEIALSLNRQSVLLGGCRLARWRHRAAPARSPNSSARLARKARRCRTPWLRLFGRELARKVADSVPDGACRGRCNPAGKRRVRRAAPFAGRACSSAMSLLLHLHLQGNSRAPVRFRASGRPVSAKTRAAAGQGPARASVNGHVGRWPLRHASTSISPTSAPGPSDATCRPSTSTAANGPARR